jgi:hypothetical protein
MGDRDRVDAIDQEVVHLPGVGRHLDTDRVSGGEHLGRPGRPALPGQAHRAEHLLQGVIDADDDHVRLVDVQTDEAFDVREARPAPANRLRAGAAQGQQRLTLIGRQRLTVFLDRGLA